MKTGKVFSQLRLEFLRNKQSQQTHLLNILEQELIELVRQLGRWTDSHTEACSIHIKCQAKRYEIKHATRTLEKIDKEIIEYGAILLAKFGFKE